MFIPYLYFLALADISWDCVPYIATVLIVLLAVFVTMKFGNRPDAQTLVFIERWSARPPLSDRDFLGLCGTSSDAQSAAITIAGRKVLAEMAMVPKETVYPNDSLTIDLITLERWDAFDSMGYFEFALRIEKEVGSSLAHVNFGKLLPPIATFGEWRVKHLVLALSQLKMQQN